MGNKRLLVCDDEPAFGRFVKNVAEDLGYEVEVTTTWQAFMQAYLTFSPTTIVLDIVMPGMDGIELVVWLGNLRSSARLIIVTGYAPDYAAKQDPRRIQGAWTGDDTAQANRNKRNYAPLYYHNNLIG